LNDFNILQTKRIKLILLAGWIIVQAICLLKTGIVEKGESLKYINEALSFANGGQFSQPKYLFYSVYIAIRLFFEEAGLGATGVYIFQLLLNLVSLFFFYKLSIRYFNSERSAQIAALLLIVCLPWQLWTTHLYTESVFINLVIIFTYFLLKPNKRAGGYFLTGFFLILLIFTRPTGMLFIPLVLIWYMIKWIRGKKWITLLSASLVSLGAFALILNYAMKGEGEFEFLKPFIEEHIICGVPQAFNNTLDLPADGNSIQGLLYYVSHNPLHFLKLSFQKLGAFFGITRTYYSPMHNTAIRLFFYPLYAFALAGLFCNRKRNTDMAVILFCGIGLFALSITLTCDDWLNRFIMPVLPYIILLATAGITFFIALIEKRISKNIP
jgi:hypothetical protein